ncbi:ataxin-7-like protein 1 isoform X2 [Pristis pectinata]|uniref:ataxin-7-like protein 1 isoform X2 n=1 Tax=Pristis pectinata TaxID=685728 RepID=UPI00223E5B48|nr:ataxin-7-like protein 1 isoform X2 [Pristis pectinata]
MMAASERRLPSPEAFVGQSWSSWIERAEALRLSDGTESEDCGKDVRKKIETMRLIREDMPIFGHCPAHDEFFLVVCNQCGQVVKPQAFQMHCERRHGSLNKLSARKAPALNSPNSILQKSRCNSVQTAVTSTHGTRSSKEKLHSPGNKVLQLDVPSKGPKENLLFVPVVNLEKIPSLGKTESSCIKLTAKPPALSPSSPEPVSPSEKPNLAPVLDSVAKTGAANAIPKATDLPLPAPVIQNGKGERSPVLEEPSFSNRRNNHKVHRRVMEKESDLNKHCGVMDPETKKHCTRSLTCKTHSLTQRRNVLGRRLAFDELLAEHRASLKNKEGGRERKQQVREAATLSPVQETATGGWASVMSGVSLSRTKPACCSASRVSLESELTDTERSPADPAPHPELPYPLFRLEINSRLSSEESDGEMTEELDKPDCHYSRLHPKPLAFCTFGSRMISRGYYVFNRRLDRFRMALNSMVERHLNSQMWRKIPPAMDSQRAPPPPASSTHSLQSVSALPVASSPSSSSPSLVGTDLKLASSPAAVTTARAPSDLPAACCRSLPPTAPTSNLPHSSSRMSWAKAGRGPGFHQGSRPLTDASQSKRKKPALSACELQPALDPPLKRNCVLSLGRISTPPPGGIVPRPPHSNTSSHNANNGVTAHSPKSLGQAGILGHSGNSIKGTSRAVEHFDPKRDARLCEGRKLGIGSPSPPSLTANPPVRAEGRKRKNAASCSKPTKVAKSPEVNCAQRKREESLATSRPLGNSHTQKAKVHP